MPPFDVLAPIEKVCPAAEQPLDHVRHQFLEGSVGSWKNGMDAIPLGNGIARAVSDVEVVPVKNDDALEEIWALPGFSWVIG